MNEDTELLRRFAEAGAQDAFTELVQRKIDFVYAAALRQTGGDAHLAQDVAQGVFLALACQAAALKRHTVLTGWLYTTTRFLATKAVRTQARWQRREQEANAMNIENQGTNPGWENLRPVIDEAMHELGEKDRDALLLRFFEGRSLAEVGAAIGLAENSARMRVDRALDKLRERLTRRGITSTAVALGAVLAAQPAVMAPAGLMTDIADSALASVGVAGASTPTSSIMNALKLITGMTVAGALGVAGTYATMQARHAKSLTAAEAQANAAAAALRAEHQRLQAELTRAQAALAAAQGELNSPLADLRALVRAAQQKVIGPLTFLLRMNSGQLSPATVKLFNLSPAEEASVEKVLRDALSEADALAVANVLDVEQPAPNRVVVRFKLYPEAGAKAYDRVVTGLTQTLGAERQAAVLTLMGEQFDLVGFGFGAWERTLTLDRMGGETRSGAPLRYTAFDRFQRKAKQVSPTGTQMVPTTSITGPVTNGDRATIERAFPAVAKLLPADF